MRKRFRALFLHALRHDVAEAAGSGSSTLLSGSLATFAAATLIALAGRGQSLAERAPWQFALLGMLAALDAWGDLAGGLLDPRDATLVATSPVAPQEYARARFLALLVPMGVKSATTAIPFVALALAGGARWRELVATIAAFAALQLACAAAAVVTLLARRTVTAVRRDVVAWSRALLLVGLSGACLYVLRSGTPDVAGSLTTARWLPTRWFAALALWVDGDVASAEMASALVAVGVTVGSTVAALFLLRGYGELLLHLAAAPSRVRSGRRRLARAFERRFVAPDERTSFRLGLALMRRERSFRLETVPLLAYPLLFLAIGGRADDGGLFALLFAHLPAAVFALAVPFLRFSDSPAGGGALAFFGSGRARTLESGARKALWFAVVLPFSLLVALLSMLQRGAAFGAMAGAVGLLASTFAVVTTRGRWPELPFCERLSARRLAADAGPGFALLLAASIASVAEWRLVHARPDAAWGIAMGAIVATVVLVRNRRAEEALPAALVGRLASAAEGADGTAPTALVKVSFGRRLRREFTGLSVFLALALIVLTAFFRLV